MDWVREWVQPYVEPASVVALGRSMVIALVTLAIGWIVAAWVGRLVRGALQRAKVDPALARFLGNVLRHVVIVATALAIAEAVGIETTSVLVIVASLGLAVGLALQGALANFASGVSILLSRPFRVGDWVTVGGLSGEVAEVGLVATSLVRPDGTRVVVPNGAITAQVVENHTDLGKRRVTVEIGVEYGVDLDDVRAALVRAAERVDGVLRSAGDSGGFALYFAGFGARSLDFQVHAWCRPDDWFSVQEDLRVEIYRELSRCGIGIPFCPSSCTSAPMTWIGRVERPAVRPGG